MHTLSPTFRRLSSLRAVVAILAGASCIGSSYAGADSHRFLAAVRQETPAAARVAPSSVWTNAQGAAAAIPGGRALRGVGSSMSPHFGASTAVVVAPLDFTVLRRGMTVVYRTTRGRLVAHALIAKMPQGWVAQGLGNAFEDDDLVTTANLVGVVVAAYSGDEAEPTQAF